MIQLRQIRIMGNGKEIETCFSEDITAPSLAGLFSDIDTHISKIKESERYNVFYTRGVTHGGPKRAWYSQDVIPFDIDGLRLIDGEFKHDFEPDIERLLEVIFGVLDVDREKCVVVSSGNGVQILVQPERPITEPRFFADATPQYALIATEINEALKQHGIPGSADTSVFVPNGLFRLPGTVNRKPNKPDRAVVLLNRRLEPQPFRLTPPPPGLENSQPWSVEKGGALPDKATRYSKIDEPGVEEGCEFLKAAKENPGDVSEAQWYGLLSILGRFSDPEKVHEYSKGHPGYSRAVTDSKTSQALGASGPRTCANVDKLWGRCNECAFYKKVSSPVSIRSKGHIATEGAHFHKLNKQDVLVPVPGDLQLYFEKLHPYVVSPESGAVFVFEGKMYRRWSDTEIRAFANLHYHHAVSERAIQEFRHAVTRANLFEQKFFDETVSGLVNFQNGVYCLRDKNLRPHSPDYGFLYTLPFDYIPGADAPNFEKFLETFTSEDPELILVLKEFLGYAICDSTYDFQKCLVLLGKGSNGKSSFFEIVRLLLGEQNLSYLPLEDLSSTTAKSALEGKLMNLCDELPTEHFTETYSFKNLFGGITQTRRLFKDAQSMRNKAKFMFSGNEMPISKDTSEGFLRRLTFVPLKAKFVDGKNADPRIVDKVKKELPGIFNVVVEAFELARARGQLSDSKAGKAKHLKYRNNIDPVRAWADDFLIVGDISDSFTTIPELFLAYQTYCDANNDKKPSKDTFLKKLHNYIEDYDERYFRKQVQKERVYVLKGVSLEKNKEVSSEF